MPNLLAAKAIPRRIVIIAGGLLVLVIIMGTTVALWLYRGGALASGEWHLKNMAVVLAEQTRQGMLAVDMALRAAADEYRDRETGVRSISDRSLHLSLHQRVAEVPQLRALLIIRADGKLVAHSNVFPAPEMDFRDLDHFGVHLDGKGPPLFFGVPRRGRVIAAHFVHTLSRRIEHPRGQFLGVATAGIDVQYLHHIYRSLELGPAGRVFLFRKDGVLLTSFPADNAEVGRSFPAHALFSSALPAAASGVLQATGLLGGDPRLIAYHSLQDYPLVIAVSSTTDYVLREWRRQSMYAAIGALGAACVTLLVTFLFARQLRVSVELAGEVAEAELRWRTALEAAGHGVWDFAVPAGRVFCSQRYREILGHEPREALLERAEWLAEIHAEDRSDFERKVDACLAGEHSTCSAEVRFNRRDGSSKWGLIRGTVVSADTEGRPQRVVGTVTDVTEQRLAQQRLSESGARLNGIIASAMDAIITIDENHNVVLFNAAAERIFRCPAREAVGRPLDRFLSQRFRESHRLHIQRFGETGVTMRRMGEQLVLSGVRGGAEEFPIDASISQVEVDGHKFYTVILRDITERRRAEEEVRKERDTAQRYLDIAGVMLMALDSNAKVTLVNRKGCELLGYPEDEILGQSWIDRFVPERDRADTWKVFRQILAGETQLTEFHENAVLTRSGAERIIAWHNRALTDENGRIVGTLSSGEDITERQRAAEALERSHRELRELYAAVHEVREAERTRIARELHDELAQWLTALKMDVSWVAARLPAELRQLVDKTQKMKGMVDTTVAAVRRIAADLRPVMIDDLGLVPALESLLHEFSQRAGVVVSLEADADAVEFHEPLATSLYRMVQEALTNIARHAQASRAVVSVVCDSGDLVVRVRDDGKGIDTGAPRKEKSFGLLGIQERAQTLGGRARFYSPPEGGTVVEIVIPLHAHRRGEART